MDYDDIIDHSDPSATIKLRFYEQYVAPYLKKEPSGDNLAYLLNEAWNAWRLSVRKPDIKNAQFVEWMASELWKVDEAGLIALISKLLEGSHDVGVRSVSAERNAFNAKVSKNPERFFRDHLELYKVLFENDFKLWSTVPYYFVCKTYGVKNDGKLPEDFVTIGASIKLFALQGVAVPLKQGNPKDFTVGIDNMIRNAGAGHESWEITDAGTLLLHPTEPRSGQQKASEQIELSEEDLENLIKECRRTVWVLRMGLTLFLNNNPDFVTKLQRNKGFKIKEILADLEQFADNRWFRVADFSVNPERTAIEMSLQYAPKMLGESGQLFFGNGERYDLVNVEEEALYEDQVLGILQYLVVSFFDGSPSIKLKLLGEDGDLMAEVQYEPSEVAKLMLEGKEENKPKPKSGELPKGTSRIAYQVRVPFGQREIFEGIIKKKKDDRKDSSDKTRPTPASA